jgi:hypothetical protein
MAKPSVPLTYEGGYFLADEPSLMPQGTIPDLRNVISHRRELMNLFGMNHYGGGAKLASTPTGLILDVTPYTKDSVFQYYLAWTPLALYALTSSAFTQIQLFTVDPKEGIETAAWLDWLYFVTLNYQVKYWDGSNVVTPAGWANIKARSIVNHYTHLVVGYTIEGAGAVPCRQRVRWSKIGDPNDTSSTTSGFVDLVDTPGEIVKLVSQGDRLFVFKTDSIWEGMYVGGADTFRFVLVDATIGAVARKGIAQARGVIYLMSADNIYAFNGTGFEPVGHPIKEMFSSRRTVSGTWDLKYAQMGYFPLLNELWVMVPTQTDYSQVLCVYKIEEKTWWRKDIPSRVGHLCFNKRTDSMSWENATANWEDQTLNWNSLEWGGTRYEILFGTFDGVYVVDFSTSAMFGVTHSGWWETQDFTSDWDIRWFELITEVENGVLQCAYSKDEGKTWVPMGVQATTEADVYTQLKWPLNVTTRTMRFRFVLVGSTTRMKPARAYYAARKGARP